MFDTVWGVIGIVSICITVILAIILLTKSKKSFRAKIGKYSIDTNEGYKTYNNETILTQIKNLVREKSEIRYSTIKARQMGYADKLTDELIITTVDNYLNELEKYVQDGDIDLNVNDNIRKQKFVEEFTEIIRTIARKNLEVVARSCDINGFTKKVELEWTEYIEKKLLTFTKNSKVELDTQYSEGEFIIPYNHYAETIRPKNIKDLKYFTYELYNHLRVIAEDYEVKVKDINQEIESLEKMLIPK